ncbi:MAG: hypothetical protein ABI743_07075 [bacterium]
MSIRALWLVIALLFTQCLATSCHHGDDDIAPPAINSITPTGTIGKVGDTGVVITASVTGTGPIFYLWSVSGGATITAGGSTTAVTLTLSTKGDYILTLGATNGSGTTTEPVDITIDPEIPVVESVDPAGEVGLPAGTVTFTADATSQPTDWEWTFELPEGTSIVLTPTAEIQLPNPGTYSGTVVATNENGDSDPFPFDFTVTQPVAPSWNKMDLGRAFTTAEGGQTSCTVLDGRIAILYNAPDGVRLARALVAYPSGMGDWQFHTISTDLTAGQNALTVYDGKLAVSLERSNAPGFWLAVATVTEPTGPGDWAIHEVDAESGGARLAVVGGALCAVYGTQFATSDEPMRFARTTATPPTSSSDWAFHSIPAPTDGSGGGGGSQIVVVGEQLIVLWTSLQTEQIDYSTRISVSDTLAPTETSDWFSQEVAYLRQPSYESLVDLGGRVGVFTSLREFNSRDGGRNLLVTSDALPLSTDTVWSRYTIESVFSASGRTSGMLLGRPYVFFTDLDDFGGSELGGLRLARSISVDPLQDPAGLSWEFSTVDVGRIAGQIPASAVIGERILVAYINDDPGSLHVAVAESVY